jgi:hypothetical protein
MRIGFYGDSFCENNTEGPLFEKIRYKLDCLEK